MKRTTKKIVFFISRAVIKFVQNSACAPILLKMPEMLFLLGKIVSVSTIYSFSNRCEFCRVQYILPPRKKMRNLCGWSQGKSVETYSSANTVNIFVRLFLRVMP